MIMVMVMVRVMVRVIVRVMVNHGIITTWFDRLSYFNAGVYYGEGIVGYIFIIFIIIFIITFIIIFIIVAPIRFIRTSRVRVKVRVRVRVKTARIISGR
jgi:uncharacterized membrane protein